MSNGKDAADNNEQSGKEANAPEEHGATSKNEYDDLKERMLRLAAEFDNYKKKVRRDIDDAKLVGKAEIMKNLLYVLDEFGVAIAATEKQKNDNVVKGFGLLYSNFLEALRKEGLSEVQASGMLNPYIHEAVMTLESDKPAGMILEVVKKGYLLGDILLRPASVIVAREQADKREDAEAKDE